MSIVHVASLWGRGFMAGPRRWEIGHRYFVPSVELSDWPLFVRSYLWVYLIRLSVTASRYHGVLSFRV